MKYDFQTIGGLGCHVYQTDESDVEIRLIAVFLHGYCAKADRLADHLMGTYCLSEVGRMVAIFPQAHLLIENDRWAKPGETAWWGYEIERLDEFEFNARPLLEIDEEHPGISAAADIVKTTIVEALKKYNPNVACLAIGGFSQGAILATELALDLELNVAALGIFSGTMTRTGLKTGFSLR